MQEEESSALLGEREAAVLRWRCRRGLVENDLFIERFFARHGDRLTLGQARALTALMDLSDNDLLDLLMARSEPTGDIATDEVKAVLAQMRERSA
ncbi:succinate dehydrogenase assembly factor 2 [Pulveribacter sp.]|uniref:FAD assembly factor SdhE n=1 Tax=Pulveribacter sp. TaxID=2678893 RepID=UPI0028B252F1|nr:succinate dehydrogenase assembly factor 2 [Pulveribacter sp.]